MAYLPTLDDLIQDLQLAKEIAIRNEQPNSLVTAVMAQAKLLGVEPIKTHSNSTVSVIDELVLSAAKEIEVTRTIVDPVTNTTENY